MTTPTSFKDAVIQWNKDHASEQIKLNGYKSMQDTRVDGLGRTIFAYYDNEKGWNLQHVGCGWSPLACIIRVLRQCCIFRMISGYDASVLNYSQKQEMQLHLLSGDPLPNAK